MRSLIPLDAIASRVCSRLNDSSLSYKFSVTRDLLACYTHFNQYMPDSFDVKTAVLEVDNAISCPCDFIFETKVGILYNGRLAVLTLDKKVGYTKLNDTQTEAYLNSIWNGDYSGDGYWFYNAYRGNEFLGELYGLGRTVVNSGTYNINKKDGVIYIGSHVPEGAEIVIEYKSDGVSDGLKMVPIEIDKMMEYYALAEHFQVKNRHLSLSFRNDYEREFKTVRRRHSFRSALYMSSKINEMFSPTNY